MLCRAGETASSLTIKNEMSSWTRNLLSNLLKAKKCKHASRSFDNNTTYMRLLCLPNEGFFSSIA